MPAWSDGEGGGEVPRSLAGLLGTGTKPGDVVGFACAGNLAQRHWAGRFSNDGKSTHQWTRGETENSVTPWGDERVSIELCCQPGATYSLEIFDVTAKTITGTTATYSSPDRNALTARIQPEMGHSYRVRLRFLDGKPGAFHVSSLGAWLEHSTASGSIPFPGDGAE